MGKETGISWTGHTFNPWIGCTQVSPGCDNCYAMTLDRRWGHDSWGKGRPRRMTSDSYWKQLRRWDREAREAGRVDLVFSDSMCDLMDDEAPAWGRERLYTEIDATPNLLYQFLTKRTHRYKRYLPKSFLHNNVWLGTTAENQEMYNVRAPHLADVSTERGAVSFISYEPAIGPLTLSGFDWRPDWLIFGGESGQNRRPMEQAWAENIKRECEERGTKFFMKQMSAKTPDAGKALIPAHLLIQEFPR